MTELLKLKEKTPKLDLGSHLKKNINIFVKNLQVISKEMIQKIWNDKQNKIETIVNEKVNKEKKYNKIETIIEVEEE